MAGGRGAWRLIYKLDRCMNARPAAQSDLVDVLRRMGIRDSRVLAAYERVPRASFVPPSSRDSAYDDVPLPIGHDLVTTQPSLVAIMVQALRLDGHERVLEIGTGLGYQTGILATLTREVFSIEWFADLAEQARQNLTTAGLRNATVMVGDGSAGLPEQAPFDGIIVAAAAPNVSEPLIAQLADGGRLVQPIGPGGDDEVTSFVKHSGRLVRQAVLIGAHFVPLLR